MERRHPSSSFVDSVMVALTAEKEEDVNREASPGSAGTVDHPACDDDGAAHDLGRLAQFF